MRERPKRKAVESEQAMLCGDKKDPMLTDSSTKAIVRTSLYNGSGLRREESAAIKISLIILVSFGP